MQTPFPSAKDQALIQIVDADFADSARRSGAWLVCRPGCTQCCVGVFAINQLDAERLRRGLSELEVLEPERARRVRERARESVARLAAEFPGDPVSGILNESENEFLNDNAESSASFSEFAKFANDELCPALDPETGTCDLYQSRPMTCRVFGPPVRSENGLGICELCYHGASEEKISACEMKLDSGEIESELLNTFEESTGARGETIVAFCLTS
jgi:Fe-S-cluster containining protein